MKGRWLILLLLCQVSGIVFSQSHAIDSLRQLLKTKLHDTSRCRVLLSLTEMKPNFSGWPFYNEELKKLSGDHLRKDSKSDLSAVFSKYYAGAVMNTGELLEDQDKADSSVYYYLEGVSAYEKAGSEAGIASALNTLCNAYISIGEPKKTKDYLEKSLAANKRVNDKNGIANVYGNYGAYYQDLGKTSEAMASYEKAVAGYRDGGNRENMAESLNNIAVLCRDLGDIPKALDYAQQALKVAESVKSLRVKAQALDNFGCIYAGQNDNSKALDYFFESYEASRQINSKISMANALNNIGTVYYRQDNPAKALEYLEKSLKIEEERGDKNSVSATLNNLGTFYYQQKNIPKAIACFEKCLKIQEEIGNKLETQYVLDNIGRIYYNKREFARALPYAERSLAISREFGYPSNLKNSGYLLYIIYKDMKRPKEALEMYQLTIKMRDSINNEETRKASLKSQLNYEYEKKAMQDSIKVVEEKKVTTLQLKRQKTQRYGLYGGLALVSLFAVFMINRSRVANKQKKLIEEQKKIVEEQKRVVECQKVIVEEKQREILASIHYAHRIQRALITNEHNISAILKRLNKK